MRKNTERTILRPDRVLSYFRTEWGSLALVTATGLVYNIGLLAGPWFEGRLAQCLVDILGAKKAFADMLALALGYIAVVAVVQLARYCKRLYVRAFSNSVNRSMKRILYGNLIQKGKAELERENVGAVITKAVSDVDACAEGMRKFTTEVFDTGVALAGYAALLFWYDARLAFLCLLFPPLSYLIAQKMNTTVQRAGAAYKESAGRLSEAALDRASGALTYRTLGCEAGRDRAFETHLADYERAAVRANIRVSAMPPLYQAISMLGALFILYFGARNVRGDGWAAWDIAAFTAFLSCFVKLSVKSSKAAKLFNAVQKAQVSWGRIKPLMRPLSGDAPVASWGRVSLKVEGLCFGYPGQNAVFRDLSFQASPGQVIGVTGPIACGKSALGKAFLCETPYGGSIRAAGEELSALSDARLRSLIGYLGHDPELLSDTIQNNVLMGDAGDADIYLRAVCMDAEVAAMPEGADTPVRSGGARLSGGQKQRIALARTLAHPRPVYILDDPFSALDRATERCAFERLRALTRDAIVILFSHRLYAFPEMDQVIWMENGLARVSTHAALMADCPEYASRYEMQSKGGERDDAHE